MNPDLEDDTGTQDVTNTSTCGGTRALCANHTMPNSKVTFDRMWLTQGTANDQVGALVSRLERGGNTISCNLTQPDPANLPLLAGNQTSYQACTYSFIPSGLFVSGEAQSIPVTISASNSACSGTLSDGSGVLNPPGGGIYIFPFVAGQSRSYRVADDRGDSAAGSSRISDVVAARDDAAANINTECHRWSNQLEPGDRTRNERYDFSVSVQPHSPGARYLRLFRTIGHASDRAVPGSISMMHDQNPLRLSDFIARRKTAQSHWQI